MRAHVGVGCALPWEESDRKKGLRLDRPATSGGFSVKRVVDRHTELEQGRTYAKGRKKEEETKN
jgi:hypothetical protein